MGDGDKTDDTTDFFDTTLYQCTLRAKEMRAFPEAADLVAKMDDAAALCSAAIANGRLRSDMPAVVALFPQMVARYEAIPSDTKVQCEAAIAAAEGARAQSLRASEPAQGGDPPPK